MYEQLADLVESLHAKAAGGKIRWQKGARGGFVTSFPFYSLAIEELPNAHYKMTLFNEEGEPVEQFVDAELDSAVSVKKPAFVRAGSIEGLTHRERMEEIYEMARREALDSERVVRGILEALKA